MIPDGWCPSAKQHRGIAAGPFGYPVGTCGQNRPLAFVDHRMGGYKRTLDNDRWRHENFVGVHAGIGRDGSLDQYTSILDASWGNGTTPNFEGFDPSNARLAQLEAMGAWTQHLIGGRRIYALTHHGVNVLNSHTISTEHEDENKDQEWTPAQIATSIRWKRWCLEELNRAAIPMARGQDMLIGHFQIDAVDRPGCPGGHWPRAQFVAALIGGDMFTRLNAHAAFFEGREYAVGKDYQIKTGVDFPAVPADARLIELDIRIDAASGGRLVIRDGAGTFADEINEHKPEAIVRVIPDASPERRVLFDVANAAVKFTNVGIVGYWT